MTAQYQLHDAGHLRAQVPPKSRAALQVNEARLALLLQAVRTSLQMQSSSHSYRLAAVDITNQLSRCQVGCLLGSAAKRVACTFFHLWHVQEINPKDLLPSKICVELQLAANVGCKFAAVALLNCFVSRLPEASWYLCNRPPTYH